MCTPSLLILILVMCLLPLILFALVMGPVRPNSPLPICSPELAAVDAVSVGDSNGDDNGDDNGDGDSMLC